MISEDFFKKTKIRYFVIWCIIGGIGLIVLEYLIMEKVNSESLKQVIDAVSGYFIYIIPLIWIYKKLKKNHYTFKTLISKPCKKVRAFEIIFIPIVSSIFSIGMLMMVACLLIEIAPNIYMIIFEESSDVIEPSKFWVANLLELMNMTLLGPIVEEMVFRGLIMNRFRIKWGLNGGIVISSLIFGILHLESVLGAFIFGILMCVIYIKTKSLLAPIACHIINNTMIAPFMLFSDTSDNIMSVEEGLQTLQKELIIGGTILIVISSIILGYYLIKNWPQKETDRQLLC